MPIAQLSITNAGAEDGTTGWTNVLGTLVTRTGPVTPYAGTAYFSGSEAEGRAYQDITLPTASQPGVDTGRSTLTVAWAQAQVHPASQGEPGDQAEMEVQFFDSEGASLGARESAGLTAPLPEYEWVQRTFTVDVPAGARTLRLFQHRVRNFGTENNGEIDAITVELNYETVATGNAVFFRLDTDTPLRLWCGINDVPIGIDSIDADGSVYLGAGRLLNVPDLEVLINGLADRVEFYLPGVSVENSNRVASGAPDIQGKSVHVGIATLDDRYQPLTAITPVWYGLADLWAMKQPKSADPSQPPTRTLVLSVGSGRTGRARARRAAYTDAQQKLLYPTDRFCDRVARYTQLYDVEWPVF